MTRRFVLRWCVIISGRCNKLISCIWQERWYRTAVCCLSCQDCDSIALWGLVTHLSMIRAT